MCGICGVVYSEPREIDKGLLRRANDLLVHRGPDDEGYHVDDRAGLAMRRLSIIDLATGHQPIGNAAGTVHIVFNGEIYNFLELRGELEKSGYEFRTRSDTEVILALYERLGKDCVKKLRGMFAFAIWDRARKRLFLARDRLGKKPLLYAMHGGVFAFASELRSLLVWGFRRDINQEAVDLYLTLQYIPSPHTIYQGMYKLPPAHCLTLENGRITIDRYWDFPLGQPPVTTDHREAIEMLRAKLREAVKLRLISEVPLGAFLSGGIDSSIVVALMSEFSEKPVKTFSIGFEEEGFSELPYAREVAKAYACDHNELVVTAEMAEILPKIAWHYGEPYGDTSALPSYYVARETRRFVTVALNGDGGDENFAGYVRYFAMKAARCFDRLPGSVRKLMESGVNLLPDKNAPVSFFWRLKRFLRSAAFADEPRRHLKMLCYFSEEDKRGLYARQFEKALDGARSGAELYMEAAFHKGAREDFVNRLLYTDFVTYLPECLMVKMDIATMANSLEGRSPFLDHEFVELAFRMPGDWKLKGLRGHKWILKKAFADKLPRRIINRGKMGFASPIGPWFRNRLKSYWETHVLSSQALGRGYFQEEALRNLWEEHQSGRRDHGYRLWALLMLELWHQQYEPSFRGF